MSATKVLIIVGAPNGSGNNDWTSVIVQSLLRQIELNSCIHGHLSLYDFSNIGQF